MILANFDRATSNPLDSREFIDQSRYIYTYNEITFPDEVNLEEVFKYATTNPLDFLELVNNFDHVFSDELQVKIVNALV